MQSKSTKVANETMFKAYKRVVNLSAQPSMKKFIYLQSFLFDSDLVQSLYYLWIRIKILILASIICKHYKFQIL